MKKKFRELFPLYEIIILQFILVFTLCWILSDRSDKIDDLKSEIKVLNDYHDNEIINYQNIINNQDKEIDELNDRVKNCVDIIDAYADKINELSKEIEKINQEKEEMLLKKYSWREYDKGFRTYELHTIITDQSTGQWKLLNKASTNEHGVWCIDGKPLCAVGQGWGFSLGDVIEVTTKINTYYIVVGDFKGKGGMESQYKVVIHNGDPLEFIVDINQLNPKVRDSGNIGTIYEYSGLILDMVKVGHIKWN